jgi:hypothetical protein
MLALQVAAVALALTRVRSLRFKTVLIGELRLRLIGNGVVIATVAVAAGAGLELLLALTRAAAAPWGDSADVIAAGGWRVFSVLSSPPSWTARSPPTFSLWPERGERPKIGM